MSATTLRAPLSLAVTAAFVTAALGLAGPGRGAQPVQDQAKARPVAVPKAPNGLTKRYYPAQLGCGLCHSQPNPQFTTNLVLLKELPIWKDQDRHADAFHAILPKSESMSKILGYDVTKAQRCLSCHAPGYHAPIDVPAANVETVRESLRQEGVSCSACHGAYVEWVQQHQPGLGNPNWRNISAVEKQEKYGLMDLRDPARRTALCVTCHVGDPANDKVVTHEMYAAGHPPLPSFEVWTFSQQVPHHWMEPSEVPYLKEAAEKGDKEILKNYHYDPEEKLPTKFVVYGGVANLRETMGLIAFEMNARVNDPRNHVPDFARYDCYACHHDLKVNGWRPERGFGWRPGHMYPITPGRVPPPAWPLELVDLAIVAATDNEDAAEQQRAAYRTHVKALYDAFNAQQYADPKLARSAADQLRCLGRPITRTASLPRGQDRSLQPPHRPPPPPADHHSGHRGRPRLRDRPPARLGLPRHLPEPRREASRRRRHQRVAPVP